jgi:CHRD domain
MERIQKNQAGGKVMRSKRIITLVVVLAAVSFAFASQDKEHGGRPLTAVLTGAAEVPGPGDTDGTGTATITLNHGQGQVCYELTVSNIGAATAAHIHTGGATVAGPVLVGLDAPADGSSKGCVNLDKAKVKEIMTNPANYYINVHNAEFPNGAVRGQLGTK